MATRRAISVSVLSLAALAGALWIFVPHSGPKPADVIKSLPSALTGTKASIEKWCGEQLLAIANEHLGPEVTFDAITYEYPATALLREVKLTSDGVTFIEAAVVRVEFTETPQRGKPVVIQTVELTEPTLRLIKQDSGKLLGFSNFIDKDKGARKPDGGSTRPSDVFAIRRIRIANGSIKIELPGKPAMVLNELTFDLATQAEGEIAAEQRRTYAIDAKIARRAVFDCALAGQLNIDDANLHLDDLTFNMQLAEAQYPLLPPALQQLVRRHEAAGTLHATLRGDVPLKKPSLSTLDIESRLSDGHLAFGDYVLPVATLDINAHLSERVLTFKPLTLSALGGTMAINGDIQLSGAYPMRIDVAIDDMRLEQAIKPRAEEPPKMAGRVDLTMSLTGDLRHLRETLDGSGGMEVIEGRLVNVPVITGLVERISPGKPGAAGQDRATSNLYLRGDHLRFDNIDLISGAIAARGAGRINFDSTLDFDFNAGPLERLQGKLGVVGDLVGAVTDKLMRYEISGTLQQPVVEVKPLGLGVAK